MYAIDEEGPFPKIRGDKMQVVFSTGICPKVTGDFRDRETFEK